MRWAALILILAWAFPAAAAPARPPDELAIGITQYPATLNPVIDEMEAKSYVLGFVRRPLTTYDANWRLVCMLCTAVPSFENGLAQKIDLPGGKILLSTIPNSERAVTSPLMLAPNEGIIVMLAS